MTAWLRARVKYAALLTLAATGAFRWARRRLMAERAIVVLMFHRVLEATDEASTHSLPAIVIGRSTFTALLRHLTRSADVLPADTHGRFVQRGSQRPQVLLTFDDGWEDNARVAWPELAAAGLPAAIFICPGQMDTLEPFWPERAVAASGRTRRDAHMLVERLKGFPRSVRESWIAEHGLDRPAPAAVDRTMDWDTARAMHQAGVVFGSHTYAHDILPQLTPRTAVDDLTRARAAIEQTFGAECRLLAYPNGDTSAATRRAAAAAGYRLAFTTREGAWTTDVHPLDIPRVNVCESRVTTPGGRFSRVAFAYIAFWQPFVAWVRQGGRHEWSTRAFGRGLGAPERSSRQRPVSSHS